MSRNSCCISRTGIKARLYNMKILSVQYSYVLFATQIHANSRTSQIHGLQRAKVSTFVLASDYKSSYTLEVVYRPAWPSPALPDAHSPSSES